ncbi:hypothetical protein MTR62_06860 [Novosphingobium sp. 1949]|uniref:Uncharacterized protein n=1 Tax=Novosphingobium organovorum TaxID=2930092 RepID=A0ABT0BBI5_9SPHN|nr:hypothetical protein [Novosphingobium organovorum]MCJ2182422.1 hypothetical protein [Novosphingobium organovorum]
MDRYRALEAEYKAILGNARREANQNYDPLVDALIEFLVKTYTRVVRRDAV